MEKILFHISTRPNEKEELYKLFNMKYLLDSVFSYPVDGGKGRETSGGNKKETVFYLFYNKGVKGRSGRESKYFLLHTSNN
jgi:hypothetical protein